MKSKPVLSHEPTSQLHTWLKGIFLWTIFCHSHVISCNTHNIIICIIQNLEEYFKITADIPKQEKHYETEVTSLAAKPGYISTPNSSAFSPNQRTNWLKLQEYVQFNIICSQVIKPPTFDEHAWIHFRYQGISRWYTRIHSKPRMS